MRLLPVCEIVWDRCVSGSTTGRMQMRFQYSFVPSLYHVSLALLPGTEGSTHGLLYLQGRQSMIPSEDRQPQLRLEIAHDLLILGNNIPRRDDTPPGITSRLPRQKEQATTRHGNTMIEAYRSRQRRRVNNFFFHHSS